MNTIQPKSTHALTLDRRWVFMSGLMIFLAGIVHLVVAPDHFDHAPAHALFFVVSGIVEIIWGLAFWRKPTKDMLVFGLLIAVSLIALWAITRVLPAPYTGVPEEIDLGGIIDKLLEVAGVIFLSLAALHGPESRRAGLFVMETVLIAVILGAVLYLAGLLSQPLFPFLRAPVQ